MPRRHPGRWLTAALALLLFAMLLNSVVRNDAFQWDVVGRYFTTAAVLDGLLLSLWLTVIGLTLHESAYAAEVVRGGILSVDAGQTEAAQATAARLVIGGDR
ncbi:hypothetical protein GCM10018780_86860 [Streptomyces lanatus]|nr:hypothetical protein GCM10018780_86860 [Streptomyces lanatus]